MQNEFLLIVVGIVLGCIGTLIGAGGGFVLVPMLLIFYPEFPPEIVTAISIAVVAVNAISGTIAYKSSGRIDLKSGVLFAIYTIPGSILGVLLVPYVPKAIFNMVFGVLLLILAVYLILKQSKKSEETIKLSNENGLTFREIIDSNGEKFSYYFNSTKGKLISLIVGFISPILGIGGGIIHVPAMVNVLGFPVLIATATSQFILAIMATASVFVHYFQGSYDDDNVQQTILFLIIGVIPGAQIGAKLSKKIKGQIVIKILALCLILVGLRILMKSFG